MNPTTAMELNLVSIECDRNPAVRVVVIAANGKMLSTGADLGEFVNAGERAPNQLVQMAGDLYLGISRVNAPVIAKVEYRKNKRPLTHST